MEKLFSKKDLRLLILPLIAEQALTLTVGFADTIMISSVGEAAVSGVSLVDMINNLLISIMAALATGGAVVTSHYIGAKKQKDACKSANQLLYTAAIFGLSLSILTILFRKPMLRLFFGSIEEDVMRNCLIYLTISAISYTFLAIYNACAALFRSMGNSSITFVVSCIMNAINVLGNAFCVYILKMGVAGVALPTLISRAIGGIILFVLLLNPAKQIHFLREKIYLDHRLVKRILFIGVPSGVENGIFQLGRVLVVSIISGFGTVQIAANGVANSLDGMGILVGQALNLAMITVIGQCVGAQDEEQIRYYTKKLILYAFAGIALTCIPILVFLHPILRLFGLGSETLKLSYILVMLHDGFAIVMWPLAFVFPNMLRACNDVKYTMIVSIFSMFTFRICFSIILGIYFHMGAIGVWIAMIIDWIFRIAMFLMRYFSGKWRKLCLKKA